MSRFLQQRVPCIKLTNFINVVVFELKYCLDSNTLAFYVCISVMIILHVFNYTIILIMEFRQRPNKMAMPVIYKFLQIYMEKWPLNSLNTNLDAILTNCEQTLIMDKNIRLQKQLKITFTSYVIRNTMILRFCKVEKEVFA